VTVLAATSDAKTAVVSNPQRLTKAVIFKFSPICHSSFLAPQGVFHFTPRVFVVASGWTRDRSNPRYSMFTTASLNRGTPQRPSISFAP
jgi:hypothetical protein